MTTDEQVMQWFRDLERGDPVAQSQLWKALNFRVQRFAAKKLGQAIGKTGSDEDITLSVFKSVMIRAERGEFQGVQSYDELWSLLLTITKRKVINHVRDTNRLKRGGGKVVGEVDLQPADGDSTAGGQVLATVADDGPDPEVQVLAAESIDQLLKALSDSELERIVEMRVAGHTNEEISKELNRSLATVERKVKMVRTIWSKQDQEGD